MLPCYNSSSHLSAKTVSSDPDYFVQFLSARKHINTSNQRPNQPPSGDSQATRLQDQTYFWRCDCCIFSCVVAHCVVGGCMRRVSSGYPLPGEDSRLCPLRVPRAPKPCSVTRVLQKSQSTIKAETFC